MKDLKTFVRENRTFIKIKSGESYAGVYKGFSVISDQYNSGKEKVAYKIQDIDDKIIRTWSCGQTAVAEEMDKIPVDSIIKITRIGATAKDTKYDIRVEAPF